MFSRANLYFAKRPEVAHFPFEILEKICLEANKDMSLCNKCHNYIHFTCQICNICNKCKDGVYQARSNRTQRWLCVDHFNYFCKDEKCDRIVPSEFRQNNLVFCDKHETKCFICGNNFKNSLVLKKHLLSYHMRYI
jgi:hypothetical protein